MDFVIPTWLASVGLLTLGLIAVLIILRVGNTFIYIPNDAYGVVERKWSLRRNRQPSFMALDGGPGFLPTMIKGGWHAFPPFQYRIHRQKLISVRNIGYLFARTGQALADGQTLAAWPADVDPGDAAGFLTRGGQGGPQRRVLRAGTYAIHTALFMVLTEEGAFGLPLGDDDKASSLMELITERNGFEPIVINNDAIAVVTVHDGPALEHGEIIAPTVGTDANEDRFFHNSFQNIDAFLAAGGRRGRQEQVLVEGTYYINRLFASIELSSKTQIQIGNVGVVISFTGPHGTDITDATYKQGELVEPGTRGVWRTPLQPGKYAINPFAQEVKIVPTTNFQLRWIEDAPSRSHDFDANLSEIKLITRDAFEPILPLSIVLHIAQEDAPFIVQQFAEIGRLVDQTLDPMVSAWFKDAAQEMTLIEIVSKRGELQRKALVAMQENFARYRLQVTEVMIGTPRAPEGDTHIDTVFEQLRARQVAAEQVATFASQQIAADKERELNESRAKAERQPTLTASAIAIDVARNEGEAALERNKKQAESLKIMAAAEAEQTRLRGIGEAGKIKALGDAEAAATKAQVDALGGPEAANSKAIAMILAEAMQKSTHPLVPQIVVGSGDGSAQNITETLMALIAASTAKGLALSTPSGATKDAE